MGYSRECHQGASGADEPRSDAAPSRYSGIPAQADRGQGAAAASAGLYGVQRRLRRRPDGRALAAGQCRHSGGADFDARFAQYPEPGQRSADHGAFAGHGARTLLYHQGASRFAGRGSELLRPRRGDHRLQREARRSACEGESDGRYGRRERRSGAQDRRHDGRPRAVQPSRA